MSKLNAIRVTISIEGNKPYLSIYVDEAVEPVATLDEPTAREVALKMLGSLEVALTHSLLLRWLAERGVDKDLVREGIVAVAESRKSANLETNSKVYQSLEVVISYAGYLFNEAELAGRKPLEIDDWMDTMRAPNDKPLPGTLYTQLPN